MGGDLIGIFVGTVVSFLLAWLLCCGKKAPEIIFVALGTLTFSYAAERLVSGWYYVGGGNGLSYLNFLALVVMKLNQACCSYIAGIALLVSYLLSRYLVRSQLVWY